MADLSILAGTTSQSILVDMYILATGAPQTGLVFNSTGLTAYYSFVGTNAAAVAITLATLVAVNSAYSSGGFKEVDATNMPGVYRFDLPNAVIAASKGREVIITFTGFAGMATRQIKLELTGVDNQNAATFGLSSIPNATAGAAGGIFIAGSNAATTVNITGNLTGNVSGSVGSVTTGVTVTTNNDKTGYSLIQSFPTNFSSLAITAGGAVTAGTISDKTGYSLSSSQTFNTTGNITGNLSGSVGSVTGAVGSVTGNVGGNVVGSVASVTAPVTAGTVSDKTGYSLSGTQTFNNTGNITGNLSGSVGSVTAPVTAGTVSDKTGYTLTSAYDAAKTATQVGDVMKVSSGTGANQISLSSGLVSLNLAQAVPTSNTAETIGDALNAARAQGFGKWVLSGTTLTLYAADGSTVVRTFTLDSSSSPTLRT